MKIKVLLVSMLAAMVGITSCSDETDGGIPEPAPQEGTQAYLSFGIKTEKNTRASSEDPGKDESDVNSLYLFMFDAREVLMEVPGKTICYIEVQKPANGDLTKPEPVKVSSKAKKLFIIANPGPELKKVITATTPATSFAMLNSEITKVTLAEVTKDNGIGYTMVNSGLEIDEKTPITDPLIDISDKIVKILNGDEEEAKKQAAQKKVTVQIERLATKIQFNANMVESGEINPSLQYSAFRFQSWTLDILNSEFYPFAKKYMTSVSNGNYYKYNFYTHDPNFDGETGKGMDKTTIKRGDNNADYEPVLAQGLTWKKDKEVLYCIENTMAAAHQLFGNATRVIIKAQYYPVGAPQKNGGYNYDWFNFGSKNYFDFADLQADYTVLGDKYRAACDDMYNRIISVNKAIKAKNFMELTQTDLDKISFGGEVVKNGDNDVIRWYQKGLNYYYYELRHDNTINGEMAFGKYGVVRNNWYSLKLGGVKGPGTPWYPDTDNPGPDDPGKEEPIDAVSGYLNVEVEVAPWVLWENVIYI